MKKKGRFLDEALPYIAIKRSNMIHYLNQTETFSQLTPSYEFNKKFSFKPFKNVKKL